MENKEFNVTVKDSSRNLSGAENMQVKRYGDGEKLEAGRMYKVLWYAIADVHNDYSTQNTDYEVCVIGTPEGVVYTASESFTKTIQEIYEQASESWDNDSPECVMPPIIIKVNQKQSKKDSKKKFLVCAFVKFEDKGVPVEEDDNPFN